MELDVISILNEVSATIYGIMIGANHLSPDKFNSLFRAIIMAYHDNCYDEVEEQLEILYMNLYGFIHGFNRPFDSDFDSFFQIRVLDKMAEVIQYIGNKNTK